MSIHNCKVYNGEENVIEVNSRWNNHVMKVIYWETREVNYVKCLRYRLFSTTLATKFIAYFETEEGWVQVGLLWDKQHETRDSWRGPHSQEELIDVRKISSFVSIGLILNKIHQFKNVKINKKCMDIGTQRPDVYSSNRKHFPWLHSLI